MPTDKDLFFRNITGNVWLYLVGILFLLALCFRLSTHIHSRLKPKHNDWSWLEVIQWTLGAMCQQGSANHPHGHSCRTMFLMSYFITYMIYTGFAAGITSLLTVKTDAQTLNWDKAMKLPLPFVVLCDSDGDRYLKERIENDKIEIISKCVDSMEEVIATLKNTNSATMMSESCLMYYLAYSMTEGVYCKMSISKKNYDYYNKGFVVKKDSVLKHPFNYWLLRFKEHGLLKRLLSKTFQPLPVCQMPPGYTEVGYKHVETPFRVMRYFFVISFVIFCIEIFLWRNNKLFINKNIKKLQFKKTKQTQLTKTLQVEKIGNFVNKVK